jgi:hypothetical protein
MMKIVLDRRSCNCYDQACETHFGWHFLREEITPVDCTVELEDDGETEYTFYIKDKDNSDKVLVVDDDNRDLAYDSWLLAWQEQQSKKSGA